MLPTIQNLQAAFSRKGYVWEPFNLIGIRLSGGKADQFDDLIGWATNVDKAFFEGTTEPGLTYLQSPMNKAGTSILKEGQYLNCYRIGFHQNKQDHPAFVQIAPVTVFRDSDRDAMFDLDPKTLTKGIFGINIHRANLNSVAQVVGPHSAGCQVFRRAAALERVLAEARKSGRKTFTYTLLNSTDLII